MAVNKVDFGGETLIDLTQDTVTAAQMRDGVIAHNKSGNTIFGTIQDIDTPIPTINVSSTGLITATVSEDEGFTYGGVQNATSQLTRDNGGTYTPSTSNRTVATSGSFLTGNVIVKGDSNLVGSNILSGVSIFGVSGNVTVQNYYTGSSAPSTSLGSNGDLYFQG